MPTLCPALLKWPLVVAPTGDNDTMYGKEGDGTGGGAGPGGVCGHWAQAGTIGNACCGHAVTDGAGQCLPLLG